MNKSDSEELATLIKRMTEEINKIGLEIAYGMREIQLEIAQGMRENKPKKDNEIANGIKEGDVIIRKMLLMSNYHEICFVRGRCENKVHLCPINCEVKYLNHKSNYHNTKFAKYTIKDRYYRSSNDGYWGDKDILY